MYLAPNVCIDPVLDYANYGYDSFVWDGVKVTDTSL